MGNFQEIAEKVLTKNSHHSEMVSCFLPLAEKTGNFNHKTENHNGNSTHRTINKNDIGVEPYVETREETERKQNKFIEEIFSFKNDCLSFPIGNRVSGIIEQFFSIAPKLKIDLLPADKRWIKTVCFGISISKLRILIINYIQQWHIAMKAESTPHKKQNIGRKAANNWLRKTLLSTRQGDMQ